MTRAIHFLVISIAIAGLSATEITTPNGIGIAPGLALVENVVPGQVLEFAGSGLPVTVSNRGPEACEVGLQASQRIPYSLASFECGFEYITDPTWLTVATPKLTVPGAGSQTAGLTLTIPDRAENWNRHFVMCIETGLINHRALGATLRMQSRILIETAANSVLPGGELAVAPSRVAMQVAGEVWNGATTVRNGGAAEATFDVLDIRQVYPAALVDRHSRFFSGHTTALTSTDWAVVEPATFILAAGAVQSLTCATRTPRTLATGQRLDEIRFIARRAPPGADTTRCRMATGVLYDRMELLRLIYTNP